MRATSFLAAAGAAVLAVATSTAQAAYDFTGKPALADITGCTPQQPGTAAPQVDSAKTNMTKADISIASWTKVVSGRKMVMYLGKDASSNTCFADSLGSSTGCRYDFMLKGTWQGLRGCGWSAPDTVSRPGYEVRNNTVYLEWQDVFAGGNRQTSRYAYPVSIALPTTVNVQTDVKILEESGIKNFNLTGLSYETSGSDRFLLLDFTMFSRWPNNLTLDSNMITLPGYSGAITVDQYTLPTCVKTDGSNSTVFTTNDFCYQNGQLRINIGDKCDVGGTYAFNFDTDCFPGSNQNNCKGKVLSANALVGTAGAGGALSLDLCNALYNTVAKVTGEMVADKPQGYFFGDTITLTATFNSPDLPIYESRLTNLILGRNKVQRTPNIGAATNVTIGTNTTLVDSAAGPSAAGALSTLATNTNFQYTPGSDTVVMKLTPNMLPAANADNSFITTDDFDSVSDFTFYASFRIYFDAVAASGQRRRRLLVRAVEVPAPALRQTTRSDQNANAALTVPANPNAPAAPAATPVATIPGTPATAQPASSSNEALVIAAIAIGVAALLASCCTLIVILALRRKEKKREEEDAFIRQRLMQGLDGAKAPVWGTAA